MEIIEILNEEKIALEELLELLNKQCKLIGGKDVFKLEAIVDEIKLANKKVAEFEVKRRSITKGESMKSVVERINNEDLSSLYRETKGCIVALESQKETNNLLLKQQLSFNRGMLNILNPKRENKIYNSYGTLRR